MAADGVRADRSWTACPQHRGHDHEGRKRYYGCESTNHWGILLRQIPGPQAVDLRSGGEVQVDRSYGYSVLEDGVDIGTGVRLIFSETPADPVVGPAPGVHAPVYSV